MRQIIKLSVIVLVFSLFTFSFTYLGASALSSRNPDETLYSNNTYIGSVEVSNKTKEEAKALLEARWSDWASAAEIHLLYKEETYPLNPSQIVLLIDETIQTAINGKQNDVHFEMENNYFQGEQRWPEDVISNLNKEKFEQDLLLAIQIFDQRIVLQLDKYLPEEKPATISSASVKVKEVHNEFVEFIKTYPSIELAPESQFSLAAFIQEREMSHLSANTYSLIAAVIYKAIQPTNFTITERHISSELPDNIEPGFEAKVNFEQKMDLKFYNPNTSPYLIKFNYDNSELEVEVEGTPLLYNYSILTSGKQEFKPRTIKQYSPLLEKGEKSVEEEGTPGVIVQVVREVYKQNGELLRTESLSEDFYPPVHRVEIHPLTAEVQAEDPDSAGESSVLLPGMEDSVPPDKEAQLIPSAPGGNAEQTLNQNDDGGLFGKPNEEPK
jgi:hypothetical protein